MKITVNGEPIETSAPNLSRLCEDLGFGDARIATARNGNYVPAAERAHTVLSEGDAIEIVAPRQGG